jgi:PAS domain S-box-containing protein
MATRRPEFAAQWLAAIVDSSGDAILSTDLQHVITSWNNAAERMYGYKADEIVGQLVDLLVPPAERQREEEMFRRIAANQRIEPFETKRIRKDGSLLDVSVTISPIRDDKGNVIGASKIARDISGRKRNEAALADLQRRLLALVSASSTILQSPTIADVLQATIVTASELVQADGYALWRLDRKAGGWRAVKARDLSQAFSSRVLLLQTPPVQLPNRFLEPLIAEDVEAEPLLADQHEAYRAEGIRSLAVFPLAIASERTGTLVFYFRQPHRFTSVEIQTGLALGNLAAAAIAAADLYENSQHAERQAAFLAKAGALLAGSLEYERTLAAVAELAVPYVADWCAIHVTDGLGAPREVAIAHVDPAKLELARELQRKYPENPQSPTSIEAVIRTGRPVMMSDIPHGLRTAGARDAEHLRILEALALRSFMRVPLVSQGRTLGVVTLVTAESGRQYTEADLRFAEDLASRAAITIENANAYRQVNEANRLKDDFLATLSHELRTPLNAVMGYAKMLGMDMLDPSKRVHAITVIERNANALKQIIEDVLDVSRIVSGKMRLNVQPVNVADVVKLAVATIMPAADAKTIRVQSVIDTQVPPVSGDPDRLQQIVWNLLSNAVKFTPKGGRIQVSVHRINSHVELTVSDTGRGIAKEFLPHLFERFRQADSGFSRDHGGLGLGLAIVRELAHLHGGAVHATSDGPGTGATFRVDLPLMIVHPPPTQELREHPSVDIDNEGDATRVSHRLDGLRVLAVDDDADALSLLAEILEAAGAQVTTASSGSKALEYLSGQIPDAIIADIGMPGMDGFEFIRQVRTRGGAARDVPAAALTAYARARDRVAALTSGFQIHIAKPVDPAELVVTVAALAKRAGPGGV